MSPDTTRHTPSRTVLARSTAVLAVVLLAAIFGFFYAWVCSTMWGLDATDPRVAITAMQAMNASVRNVVFAPAFFGTGVAALLAALIAGGAGSARGRLLFVLAGLVHLVGAMALTLLHNVPMNDELAAVVVPDSVEAARAIWVAYSGPWQQGNVIRTMTSGVALVLGLLGLVHVWRSEPRERRGIARGVRAGASRAGRRGATWPP